MSTSKHNDVRIQFVIDSRIIAIIKDHFESTGIPINSVSDLVRKALQTFALSVMDDTPIPVKEVAQEAISELAQHGRGFGRDYNALQFKNSLTQQHLPSTSKAPQLNIAEKDIQWFITTMRSTREEAITALTKGK